VNPYRALYLLGITPWERDTVPQRVVELADSAERSAPPGRALDVGCGTGRDAVYLSGRGWTVTGVDAIPRAIEGARRRARAANAEVTWVLGDVTRLQTLGIDDGYNLVIDRGCFHGLSDAERERCASGVTALAAPGARLLMFAFHPRKRGLGPRGITPEQIERHFTGGWRLEASAPDPEAKLPRWIGDAKPTWYQLERAA
jgi:SAM-dependent methyltransferase